MPWTADFHAAAMRRLPQPVRLKAMEIANAVLADDDLDEGKAIRVGIARAKQWAAARREPDAATLAALRRKDDRA